MIETLVASAIVMMSMGTLLQLFASGLDRMYRVENIQHRIVVYRQITQEIHMLNPATEPEGSGDVEGVAYVWKSFPYGSSRVISMDDSRLSLQLYRVVVSLEGIKGGDGFEVVQLGWRKILAR